MYTVYKHVNKINGKVYIGQTAHSVNRRWRKDGSGYKIGIFKLAIQKNMAGITLNIFIIRTGLTKEEANTLENRALLKSIKTFICLYNITDGGEGFLRL